MLRGRPTISTRDGIRQLNEGDVLPLPHGRAGDRTIRNDTADVVRVLRIFYEGDPDVAEYPDSGKVGTWIGDAGRFFRDTDAIEHPRLIDCVLAVKGA